MLNKFPAFFPLLLIVGFSYAQPDDSSKLVVANIITIHSKVLNDDRKIQIYTPALSNGDNFRGQPLPVLYLLDGDALTGLVASELNYLLTCCYILPPMIIVGISNYDHDRLHDLTPSIPKDGFGGRTGKSAFGGADKFIEFISTELFPYIDSHYKTDSFRILAGHSMGGLLSFHCLVNHPSLFNAYIAISPSLWWDSAKVLKVADTQLNLSTLRDRFLFFSDASEGGNMHLGVLSLDSMLIQKHLSGLSYKYIRYPEEAHGSEPVKAIYDALNWLYPNWYPVVEDSTAFLVDRHFSLVSAKYGYRVAPPEWYVAKRGQRILNSGRIDDAIGLFQLNVKNYPASAEALLLLGNAFLKKNDTTKAIECYKKATRLTPDNKQIEQKIDSLTHPQP